MNWCLVLYWYDVPNFENEKTHQVISVLYSYWLLLRCTWSVIGTVNFILTNVKRRSIWIVYCSITLHINRNTSQQLYYSINVWKDCYLEGITPNFCWRYSTKHGTLRRWDVDESRSFEEHITFLSVYFLKKNWTKYCIKALLTFILMEEVGRVW